MGRLGLHIRSKKSKDVIDAYNGLQV